ncbi:hypothetical protein AB8U03_08030 [Clostridium sp. Mt-5]|uniref:Uncharacterized protein n=1 Tax=Clostridium moutaii TaxID=3240932 RepID=A0ABV4BQ10_9CLOT
MSRHHRRHRSGIKDESYYIPDEKSPSSSNFTDIDEKNSEEGSSWQTTVYPNVNSIDEVNENQEESYNEKSTLNNPPENTPYIEVNNSSYSSHGKHHSNKCNSIGTTNFIDTLKKYIGEMVTVCTTGGDPCKCNFTGILLGVNNYFIRLVIKVGAAPIYQARNNFSNDLNTCSDPYSSADNCNSVSDSRCENSSGSTLIDIPTNRIAAFLHSNV